MRERKFVKLRCDMYSDTKFKIIDTKPDRDLIHYVWMAIVILAGKVDLEGELYLSKNIPYTIETLAIEFNRDIELVKLALDVLIELEMVEITEHNIYRVKNFAKHQNIKTKKKNEEAEEQIDTNKQEVKVSDKSERQISYIKENQTEDKININEKDNIKCRDESNSKAIEIDKALNKDNIMIKGENPKDNNTIFLEKEKRKKRSKKKEDNSIIEVTDEESEEKGISFLSEGERSLEEGETLVKKWSFSG
jgi:phage replisome organizer, putative, N-terminal region